MAFLEWRKFNFFELKKNVDDGCVLSVFKDSDITVTSSGNNNLILGDSIGQVHIVSRTWHVTTFRAYEIAVQMVQQIRNLPYLVTIGEDEYGSLPLVKVWDTSRMDKNHQPYCMRVTKTNLHGRAVLPSVLCVHESMQLMAIGFADGTLVLYRGDVTRERGSRVKILRETSSAVTGLAFKQTANTMLLYVATENSIYIYNITHRDKEVMSLLDNNGCAKNCAILAESMQEGHFMVARDDAIYCYTSDGKGPCYAVEGEKNTLQWFRSYLIIVSKSTRLTPAGQNSPVTASGVGASASAIAGSGGVGGGGSSGGSSGSCQQHYHLITVLDIQNKFIVFQAPVDEIRAVLNEWGGFYIIDADNRIFHLNEKDLQAKLAILFKKNLYDIAIRIAKSQQYDADGLVDIFRQYGDHLYGKSDFAGAIDQYVKTIGKLEPSYVIRKFMDSKHIDKLTNYLEALHKQGHATEDHTTLLLNCFTKLNKAHQLKEFVLQKDKEVDFDVDIAIKVCRAGSPQEALMLAKRHNRHDWYIKLLLEDHRKYADVVDYIAELSGDDAQHYMKKYGAVLIRHAGHQATQFLKKLCTKTACPPPSQQRADAEDYIHLFLSDSQRLVEFIDHLIAEGCAMSARVYDTLLEHYLHVWKAYDVAGGEHVKMSAKVLKLLQNPDVQLDKHQALVVCHMHGFAEGILYLYEEQKLYQQILRHHIAAKDADAVLACCKRFGHQEPTLWVQALWSCVRATTSQLAGASSYLLPEVLDTIAKDRLLSPQLVIEAVGAGGGAAEITLAQIKRYVTHELRKEQEVIAADHELTHKYRADTAALRRKLEQLRSGPVLIQGARCAACHHPLDAPSLHFLCAHSYHHHCFQSYADNENECLACQPDNKKVLELLRAREHNKDLHESFHSQLDKTADGFALAAEYFGRGVFNTVKVITGKPRPIGSGGGLDMEAHEAHIRIQKGRRLAPVAPIAEERRTTSAPAKAMGTPLSAPRNPYDAAMDPFRDGADEEDHQDDDSGDTTKKFKQQEDDYDKNLNPFAS